MRGTLQRVLASRVSVLLAAVLALYVGSAWLKVRHYDGNPSALVGFGCRAKGSCWLGPNRASVPARVVVFRTGGYDGQFFYYLGREFFGGPPATVDSAPFRRARIGLPLLASPLLASGRVGQVVGIPALLLGLHLLSVWLLARFHRAELATTAVFAFNPFSLLCFLLCAADGAALSLAVVGVCAMQAGGRSRPAGWCLLAFAVLTKETMLLVPAALAATWLFERNLALSAKLGHVALLSATVLPAVLWWHHVGFSVARVARHGTVPGAGLVSYLPHADGTRLLLAALFFLSVVAGALLLPSSATRAAAFALLGGAALVSTATADEYWAVISNVARLFTPMAAAPVLLERGALAAVASEGRRGTRGACALWAACLLLLTLVVVLREALRRPLPFYVTPG